ncbi:cytochrome P450 [soil metagenome]
MITCPFRDVVEKALGPDEPSGRKEFPLMPLGEAVDMGRAADGAPLVDPRIFDSAEFARNPYPYYRILRDHHPVFHDTLHNCYWVTRYDDVTACYLDEEGFNTIPKGMSSGVLGNTQLELSGIEHRRRRNVYGRHLVGKALTRRVAIIERLAAEMIESWFDGSASEGSVVADATTGELSVELGLAFANEFPIRVVGQILGFPDDARADFYYWYSSMMNGLGGSDTAHVGVQARQDLEDFVGDLVARRRADPTYLYDEAGDPIGLDIISELCVAKIDGDVMSTEEITSNIALIVGGGGETTRGAILNLWFLLLQHPEQLAAVRADESLWDAAFHETLRVASSIGGQPRHNTWDFELHGVDVPAGSLMHMVDFSANHDERVFAEPERFDIFRPDLYTGKITRSGVRGKHGQASHMAFGVGPHLCPGAWISHQESVVGSRVLARMVDGIEIDVERMPKDIDGTSLAPIGLGAIRALWLRLPPRG